MSLDQTPARWPSRGATIDRKVPSGNKTMQTTLIRTACGCGGWALLNLPGPPNPKPTLLPVLHRLARRPEAVIPGAGVMLQELGYDGVGHIWLDKVADR